LIAVLLEYHRLGNICSMFCALHSGIAYACRPFATFVTAFAFSWT